MKISRFTIGFALVLVVGCKKSVEDLQRIGEGPNVSVKNGHLVFQTQGDYEKYLQLGHNAKQQFIMALHQDVSFISARDKTKSSGKSNVNARMIRDCDVSDEVIEDNPELFDLLDRDGVTQIGRDLWRLDYCNNRVFLISESDALTQQNY